MIAAMVTTGCKKSAEDHLKVADQFFKEKKYTDASLNYRNAIKQNSRYGEAYYGLGLSELEQGNGQLGFDAVRQAAELLPARTDIKVRLADLFVAAYQSDPQNTALYEALRKVVGEITAADKNSFDALRMNGNLALLDRKAAEAVEYFKKANEIQPLHEYLTIGYAQALMDNGQTEEADKLGRQLIAKKKDFGPIYNLLYRNATQQKQGGRAEELLKEKVRNIPGSPEPAIQLAAHYASLENKAAVQSTLQSFLETKPLPANAHLAAGDFYVRLRDPERAVAAFEQGIQADPANVNVLQVRIASVRILENRLADAVKILDGVLAKSAEDHDALMLKANLLLDDGDKKNLDQVIAMYGTVLKNRPNDGSAKMNLGRAQLMKGDLATARKYLQESSKQMDAAEPSRLLLATVNILDKRSGDAITPLEEVLGRNPKNAKAQFLKIAALMESRRYDDAKPIIDELVRAYPSTRDLRVQQGLVAIGMKRYKEAEAIFNRLATERHDSKAVAGLAETFLAQQQFDRALKILSDEASRNPQSAALSVMLGKAATQAGQHDVAILTYEKLAAARPKDSKLALALGDAHREKGDHQKAIQELGRAITLNPKDPMAHLALGMAYYSAGNAAESIKSYRQVLAMQPGNPSALNNLAYSLAESTTPADLEEALRFAERAVKAAPSELDFRDTLGWVYLKKKNFDSALQIFQGLAKEKPENPSYQHHLGIALLAKNDANGARRAFETAIRNRPDENETRQIQQQLQALGGR